MHASIIKTHYSVIFLFFIVYLAPQNSLAEAYHAESLSYEQQLIERDRQIGKWFYSAAEGLDLFLVGKTVSTKKNDTKVILENSTITMEGQGVKNQTSINANLRLPNTEEYWQLKFASYDEREDSRDVESKYLRANQRVNKYGATVGFFEKLGDVRVAFQPRIVFEGSPQLSQSLSFESIAKYRFFSFNPKLELYADPTKGTGIYTGFNFNQILSKKWSLTLINEGDYQDKIHLYSVNNGFSFGQYISEADRLAYSYIANSTNQPSYHLETHDVSVLWVHSLYKDMLDAQLNPHLIFPLSNAFKGLFEVVLTFNIYF